MTSLIFDCDGVLADTERYGHLPAFNAMFDEFGLPVHWSEDEYGRLLKIGGGKERMASLFQDPDFVRAADIPPDDEDRRELLGRWHRSKTEWFRRLVAGGQLPARPGISRVITAALDADWTVAVASTSARDSVAAVLEHAIGSEMASRVPLFVGDMVPAKKPDPAVYLLAVSELGLDKADTIVVEDSRNGLLAATGAGLPCVITVNGYTREEKFDEAALVVTELGDPGRPPIEVLANRSRARPGAYLTLDDLRACAGGAPPAARRAAGTTESNPTSQGTEHR